MAGNDRVTQIGKQTVFSVPPEYRVTAVGKEVTFPTHNDQRVTAIGKQVVWSDVAAPSPPPPTFAAPAAVQARGGACYLDSFLEYDGRNVSTNDGLFPTATVTLSGGSTWAAGETLTLTASVAAFVSGDVGNVLILHSDDDTLTIRFTIGAYSTTKIVTGVANVAIPSSLRSVAIGTWDVAVDEVGGLDHLEGEYVGILADDHVVGSPNNARIPLRRVVDGAVSLGDFYTHVFVGLSYLSDLETLDIDKPTGSTLKGTTIDINRVGLMLLQSRPCFVGGAPPENDGVDPLQNLEEMPLPTDPTYEDLVTGYREVNIKGEWNSHGRVFIRSVDPTPHTVLAAVPNGLYPNLG